MSRSFVKDTNIISQPRDKDAKSLHNKKVRKTQTSMGNGSNHKKQTNSYDICDWKFVQTTEDLRELKEENPRKYHKRIGK